MKYAIRLPANDNLQRNIAELLTRPVGRPSHKPVVRFKSFLYQAAFGKLVMVFTDARHGDAVQE